MSQKRRKTSPQAPETESGRGRKAVRIRATGNRQADGTDQEKPRGRWRKETNRKARRNDQVIEEMQEDVRIRRRAAVRRRWKNTDTEAEDVWIPGVSPAYATLQSAPVRNTVQLKSCGIPESHLVEQLRHFLGFSYDFKNPHYPYDLPGVKLPQSPPRLTNCCCFAEAMLVKAWANARDDGFEWNLDLHNKMMITDSNDLFSPVTAAIESGMGSAQQENSQLPKPWTLMQGWRKSGKSGHTLLILDVDERTRRILTLEANAYYGLNGVGYRHLGNIGEFYDMHPGKDWWVNERLWTWEQFRESYPDMRLARLNVYDIGWVRGH